jgi:hypothetical protein
MLDIAQASVDASWGILARFFLSPEASVAAERGHVRSPAS